MDPLAISELSKLSREAIPFRARPGHVHHTWARTFSSLPELFIQPESLAEVEKVVDLARTCRKRLVTVGSGHSPSNLTCTSSWLVNLDRFNKILSVDLETGLIVMEGGIRLYKLSAELEKLGLTMPSLGSINEQSIAGVISTGTHGSSLRHGLISDSIIALKITLASGKTVSCSLEEKPDLFRAALLSLGALGIITEVTFQAVPAFKLKWQQTIDTDSSMLGSWNTELWKQSEFVRVWWFPYTRRAVVWKADKTHDDEFEPKTSYYDGALGYYIYHNLLFLSQKIPRLLPWIEWFVFGMQYGFANGSKSSAVQPSSKAFLMNCLYSQFVNEWAIPLEKGPEAIRRLSSWLNHLTPDDPDYVPHNIPFSADGLYVHAPVEVRVSNSDMPLKNRPLLSPMAEDGPSLYLNATLYRPYLNDPPCRERYYQGFEYLMKELGGKPHWAKNFETYRPGIEAFYGKNLETFRKVRDESDPEGMFVGQWHRDRILAEGPKLELEEVEKSSKKSRKLGVTTHGTVEQ